MLEGLDQIQWSELSHAYGPAADVPDLLRDLHSGDPEARAEALDALWGNIWHQGTVYEASAYAVPFLIELLAAPGIQCKAEILGLLRALGTGSSYLEVHKDLVVPRAERSTTEFQTGLTRELEWVRAAETAVRAGVPVYLELLPDPDTLVRTGVPFLLAACANHAEAIAPALLERLDKEADPAARASVLLALASFDHAGVLDPAASADFSRLSRIMGNREEQPLARLVSALCRVHLDPEAVLDDVLAVFRATVEACGESFERMPWFEGATPISAVSDALTPWPDARRDWLLELLDRSTPATRLTAAWELLQFCRRERLGPQDVVPHLARLVADPDAEVRGMAAAALPCLGKARSLAVEPLRLLSQHDDPAVRALSAETAEKLLATRDTFELRRWLKKPSTAARLCDRIAPLRAVTIAGMIATLERGLAAKTWSEQNACASAAARLEWIGPPARRAAPVLRRALESDDQWVRVHAARALWRVTRDASDALPALLEELRCRPAGLLAADCLGSMGGAAHAAAPALKRIVDSETRLVEMGSYDDWIDQDEAFQAVAQEALMRIQTAPRPGPGPGSDGAPLR